MILIMILPIPYPIKSNTLNDFLIDRRKNLGTFWRKLYLPASGFMFMDLVLNARLKSSYIIHCSYRWCYFFKLLSLS